MSSRRLAARAGLDGWRLVCEAPAPMSPLPLDALDAFVQEHRRCDVLDGGVANGFVWFQCSCGGRIMHPAGELPKSAPAAP